MPRPETSADSRKSSGKTLRIPLHLPAISVPPPPASFDGSRGRKTVYPILGNDHYGDCYEADALHCVQTWTGAVGTQAQFDPDKVVSEYLALSGGDNGLSDDQVFPHWKGPGFQGHRILDDMTIDPRDDNAIRTGLALFNGGSWTASLADVWLNVNSGGVWDAARPNPNNGHAMHLSGYDGTYYHVETWGFAQAVRLTPRGLKNADPEVTVQFSLEMFNMSGVAPHNGMTYDALAALWHQLGGIQLPPNPFVVNPPPPPSGGSWTFNVSVDKATGKVTTY